MKYITLSISDLSYLYIQLSFLKKKNQDLTFFLLEKYIKSFFTVKSRSQKCKN